MTTLKKVNAFIINRNLLTTVKATIEFLLEEPMVQVVILDQNSTYPPLLDWYNQVDDRVVVHKWKNNEGPYSVWDRRIKHLHNSEPYIVADSDCTYEDIPDDWLQQMLKHLQMTSYSKVGFSLKLSDVPDTPIGIEAKTWEAKFWTKRMSKDIFIADIDTTFALYKENHPFTYQALRLDSPYTIRHEPWYLTSENITDEWKYYLKHASNVSSWGNKLKKAINIC